MKNLNSSGSVLRTIGKIILAVLSCLLFLSIVFWTITYFFGGLSYMYHSQAVVTDLYIACAVVVAALIMMILIIVSAFKSKSFLRIICVVLLIISILAFALGSFVGMASIMILGYNGCSYTEDIANYGKYDVYAERFMPNFFPESINDDMNVVKFVYYDKYADTEQIDLFLEVQFDSKEKLDEHLAIAKSKMKTENVYEYQNPYNSSFTDIILCSSSNETLETYHHIEFYDKGYRSVDMNYSTVSYSYDELTIIYSYTQLTRGDITYGNNPDDGEYYPAYLKRFGVEFDVKNSVTSEDIVNSVINRGK